MLAVQRIGALLALTISLYSASSRAQTSVAPPAPTMPDPVLLSDWGTDKPFYTAGTRHSFTVIRQSPNTRDGYIAYGVDVGHKMVLFQILLAGTIQLQQFQLKLNTNNLLLALEPSDASPYTYGITGDIGKVPPPPMPGGPIGIPYSTILATRLIYFGESFYQIQNLTMNTPIPVAGVTAN